ncbi:MAG TPA: DUF1906 domain-containing protein [Candidatus Limnocylindrales bacterium]
MAIEGVDYSWGRPRPAELSKLGKRFAVRYVSYDTTGKNLTRDEADRLIDAGLSIVTNWENSAGDQLGGRDRGRQHAAQADRLHRACGGPGDRPVYFSTDFDATAGQLATCYEYLRGCADLIGWDRVGVYGGRRTMIYMQDRGVRWLWQTYAWSGIANRFDSNDLNWVRGVHIHQYNNGVRLDGADTDLDRATTADFGQWGQDDDMPYKDWPADHRRALAQDVVAEWFRRQIPRPWDQNDPTQRADQFLAWFRTDLVRTREEVARLRGELAGLSTLVQQLAGDSAPLTTEQFTELLDAVHQAAREPGERLVTTLAAATEALEDNTNQH